MRVRERERGGGNEVKGDTEREGETKREERDEDAKEERE